MVVPSLQTCSHHLGTRGQGMSQQKPQMWLGTIPACSWASQTQCRNYFRSSEQEELEVPELKVSVCLADIEQGHRVMYTEGLGTTGLGQGTFATVCSVVTQKTPVSGMLSHPTP